MTISEIPASCTADGKTEGKRCLLCNKLLVAQTVLDKLGHNFGDWIITKPATNSQEGERMHICSVCNVTEYDVIDILPYDDSLGSAKKISDKTVIVSIFANDLETSWDFGTNKDKETISIMHEHFHLPLIGWRKIAKLTTFTPISFMIGISTRISSTPLILAI